MTRELGKEIQKEASERLEERKVKEADMAKEILERLKTLAKPIEKTEETAPTIVRPGPLK